MALEGEDRRQTQMIRLAFIAAMLALHAGTALAQEPASSFPSRPVRIFGQGTGSTADYLSRFLAQRLQERWSQPVIVDSRSGAGGTIPTDIVRQRPADGYNGVRGQAGPFVSGVTLYPKPLPDDLWKGFEPISMVGSGVTVL